MTQPHDIGVPGLAGHPGRLRWNARYAAGSGPGFAPHPLGEFLLGAGAGASTGAGLPPGTQPPATQPPATQPPATQPPGTQPPSLQLPAGPVLELACGTSGSALLAAAAGRAVTAVDVSEVALQSLAAEAARRGVAGLVTAVHADLPAWAPPPGARYALVLCTRYWDAAVFAMAAAAVAPGGLLAWEAFTEQALAARPGMCPDWCLRPGEPASLLPAGFTVLHQADLPGDRAARRLLARYLS